MKQILAVVGPTATGKTTLAIALAAELGTEIISADSMQFYRGMEIGTGAPSTAELAEVRHHFIGSLDPSEDMCAADFADSAREVVETLNDSGRPAVVVGGSGLYIKALLDGLFTGPGKDPALREELSREALESGVENLHRRLNEVDPEYAQSIGVGDLKRIIRGLEVHQLSGEPISRLHSRQGNESQPFDAQQVGIEFPREQLYACVNARVESMLDAGWSDEVQRLLDEGRRDCIERLKALGYRELAKHLRGEATLEETTEEIKKQTRRFAKRQLSWFRRDTRIDWVDGNTFETLEMLAKHILGRFLQRPR